MQYNNTNHTKGHNTLEANLYTKDYEKNKKHLLYTIKR